MEPAGQTKELLTLTSPIPTDGRPTDPEIEPVPHPGEILRNEFLEPLGVTPNRLARDIHTTGSQISKLMRGAIRVSADMALRLSTYFGNSAEFWHGLQEEYDLWQARRM